ncbi:hypothetical protein F66182_11103 [Fusarium sp. NRRL 66182]|nr:hypothetical protein F66182_11103 [Fusarium sp. NRRL 66182]
MFASSSGRSPAWTWPEDLPGSTPGTFPEPPQKEPEATTSTESTETCFNRNRALFTYHPIQNLAAYYDHANAKGLRLMCTKAAYSPGATPIHPMENATTGNARPADSNIDSRE